MAKAHPPVPAQIVERLRSFCMALPEVREEAAWVGQRWRIRQQTFAHVLMINAGRPPAYAQAAATDGPACVLTFRSGIPAMDLYAFRQAPFFKPNWFPDIVGVFLDDATDWDELGGYLRASYRRLAPRKLVEQLNSGG